MAASCSVSPTPQGPPGLQALIGFVERCKSGRIESTRAELTNYSGALYNVEGSSNDPTIQGLSWKRLLQKHGINGKCYVTNTGAGGSHPEFSVGGHMTPNDDGRVAHGGTTYLMPLCYWHNSTARDGTAFSHSQERMLKLTGYMQGELAATFQMRLPSEAPFCLVYYSGSLWRCTDMSESQANDLGPKLLTKLTGGIDVEHYVVFGRTTEPAARYFVREAHLPTSKDGTHD